MKVRLYVTIFFATFGVLIAAWFGIVIAISGVPTVSSGPTCALLSEKQRIAKMLAEASDHPRLFLVSGSSTHFGLSAETIEKALGIPTVNYGSHAEMRLSVMLVEIRHLVRPGDIVLLSPEYERYTASRLTQVLIDYLFACGTKTLQALPWTKQIEATFKLSPTRAITGIAALFGFDDIAERFAYINLPLPSGERYEGDVSIGPRGDAIINLPSAVTSQYRRRVREAPPAPLIFNAVSEDVEAIGAFAAWAKNNEIRVIATWPNTVNFTVYRTAKAHDFFDQIREFYRSHGIPIIGTPESVLFETDAFFDHEYHLHQIAVIDRTKALIPLLRTVLEQIGSNRLQEKSERGGVARPDVGTS